MLTFGDGVNSSYNAVIRELSVRDKYLGVSAKWLISELTCFTFFFQTKRIKALLAITKTLIEKLVWQR